jgi:hypothetical protein
MILLALKRVFQVYRRLAFMGCRIGTKSRKAQLNLQQDSDQHNVEGRSVLAERSLKSRGLAELKEK